MFHKAEHVLSHCQRRLSTKKPSAATTKRKPDGLHIRQPSLSHSVSSAASSPTSSTHSEVSSLSSLSSSSSSLHRHAEVVEFDPLFMHPTYTTADQHEQQLAQQQHSPQTPHHAGAPARLADRPFIALFADEDEPRISQEEEDEWRYLIEEQHRLEQEKKDEAGLLHQLPLPTESPTPLAHTGHDRNGDEGEKPASEATDYFLMQKRPAMPRSHWSASTIQTALDLTPTPQLELVATISNRGEPLHEGAQQDAHDEDRHSSDSERQVRPQTNYYQNFSYKRSTVPPKRPPLKDVDSVDNFMKRGGWKRRGIVFQQDSNYRTAATTTSTSDDGLF